MATLTERLVAFGEAQEVVKRDIPASTIFSIRSGTKDIQAKFQIGGKAFNMKKVARQPLQIYRGKEYLHNVNKKRDVIKAKLVPLSILPKTPNRDVKVTMSDLVNKVYGFEKMGGAGVQYAEGYIQKAEEIKLIKMAYLKQDVE